MAIPGRAGRAGSRAAARLDGLTEAVDTFENLPAAFRDEIADTLATGAGIIESEAKSRVPYDEGDLERSIGTNIRDDGMEAAVGSGIVYAPFVEFGTVYTAAQPWLYPAFRTGARYIRRRMKTWPLEAWQKVRARTKRGKRANTSSGIVVSE